jgi:thiol:disulfide interchange protein DsbD
MKKLLLILTLFLTSLFGANSFLEPKDAFKSSIKTTDTDIIFTLKLDKTIYVYDEYLKVSVGQTDITKELDIQKPVEYDGFIVHFNKLEIKVPKVLAEKKADSKNYEIKFEYQGCSKAGLCYSPMSETYKNELSKPKENGGFLDPKDAFKVSSSKTDTHIVFNIKLDKSIYLYDEYLKVTIKPQNLDITKELNIKKPVEYDGFIVHFDSLNIKVPLSLIKNKIGDKPYSLELEYQECSKAGLCYSPMKETYLNIDKTTYTTSGNAQKDKTPSLLTPTTKTTDNAPVNETDAIAQTLKGGNVLLVLATFFGFGLLLSLTPCIFPMIPILSSIIVQQSKQDGGKMSSSKGFMLSLIYVLAMSFAYTIAGVLAGVFGANIQAMLQNPFVIVAFAGIFVALALSMFGYYEIGLPSSWQTKLNKTSDESSKKGGIVGVAIMGFLSALIVGPCVAPPLAGALVYIGQTGDAVLGGAALFVMSMGMGLPLLAIGLGAGKYMPKPGGWMTTVSKVFGVIMLAIAIWMLERIVPFYVTILLTFALLMGSSYYLLKKGNKFGKFVAALLMLISTAFVMYNVDNAEEEKLNFKYVKNLKELQMIVAHSKKPVMVDFWATWCVSCKELDNITFKDEDVKKELNNYLLIKVDVTKNSDEDKEIMKHFNLFGPPALIFYKDGIEEKNKRIIGYKSPKEFLEITK